jgi:hypothetical protein
MAQAYELSDTDPRAMEVWLEALRRLTPGEKLKLVFEMMDFMHQAAIRQIQKEHPGIAERDMLRMIAARRYGQELADRVYPRTAATA